MDKNLNKWKKVNIDFKNAESNEINPRIVSFIDLPPGTETCSGIKVATLIETLIANYGGIRA